MNPGVFRGFISGQAMKDRESLKSAKAKDLKKRAIAQFLFKEHPFRCGFCYTETEALIAITPWEMNVCHRSCSRVVLVTEKAALKEYEIPKDKLSSLQNWDNESLVDSTRFYDGLDIEYHSNGPRSSLASRTESLSPQLRQDIIKTGDRILLGMYLEFGWEDLTDNSKTWLSVSDLVHDEESFYKELPSKFSEKHYYSGLELTSEHKRWIDDFGSKLYLLILARLLKDLARRMNMVLIYELFLPYHSDSMIIREELMRPFSSFRCDTTRVVLPDLLNRTALSECLSDFFSLVYYVCDALTHDPEFLNARSTIRHPDYGQGRKPVYIDRQDPPTFLLRHLAWKTLFKVSVAETALDQVDSFVAYFKMRYIDAAKEVAQEQSRAS